MPVILPQGIVSSTVLEATLSQKVNEVLGLTYARPILQLLHESHQPVGYRVIDVTAVGASGSAKSTNDTLRRLVDIGWVDRKDGKYCINARGELALDYSIQGDLLDRPLDQLRSTIPRNAPRAHPS